MPDNVARSIMGAHGERKKQHIDFVAHRLQSTAVAFHAPIKMNTIHLPGNRNKSKHVDNTKEDTPLLGQLYNDNEHQGREQRPSVWSRECRLSTVPIPTWRPKKWSKVGPAILLGSRLNIWLWWSWRQTHGWCPYGAFFSPDASIKSFRDYADKKVIPSRYSWPTLKELMSPGTAICQTV